MATRVVTSAVKKEDGSAWVGAPFLFELSPSGRYRASPAETYPRHILATTTDSSGNLSVTLLSGPGLVYAVTGPDRDTFMIAVEDGSAATLEALRASYSAAPVSTNDVQNALNALFPSGVAPIAVQEDDTTKVAQATTLDFGTALNVTESPTGEANITVDLGTGATQAAAGNHSHTIAPANLSTSGAARGDVPFFDGTNWGYLAVPTLWLGPWYFVDLAASATTEGQLLYAATTTTVALYTTGRSRIPMPAAGRVIGGWLLAQNVVTAGTATLQVGNGGVGSAFASGAVQLNTTDTQRDAALDVSTGVTFASGDNLSVIIVTNGAFAPTTLEVMAWLLVRLEV